MSKNEDIKYKKIICGTKSITIRNNILLQNIIGLKIKLSGKLGMRFN